MKAWIANAGQKDRILATADPDATAPWNPPAKPFAGDAQPARRRSVDGRHGLVTDMVGAPLHRQTPLPTRILAAAAALLALAACEPAFGLGLPSETALEDGAANTLTHAKTFGITGTYSLAGSVQWTIDLQLVRPSTAHAIVSTSDQKVEAVITGDHAYFRGQKFLAAHMAGDPQSQNLARAAGNSWWKGPPGYIPAMKEFTDGAAFRTAFLGSANTHRTDHLSVDGQAAVGLSGVRADIYIAAAAPFHLLRVHLKKDVVIDAMSDVDFHYGDFDREFGINPPTDVIDFSNLSTLPPIYSVVSVDTSRCGAPCSVSAQLKNLGGQIGASGPSTVTFTATAAVSGSVLGSCQATVAPDVGYNGTTSVSCVLNLTSQPENGTVVTAAANNPGRS